MPTLHLTEDDVRRILTMEMALEGVEAGFRKMALEEAFSMPRVRCQTDQVMLHVLPAAAKTLGLVGFKAYTTHKKGALFHVTLYDGKTGAMLAIIQADYLGQMRTGAASGVATKYLARKDSVSLGLFGTGKQAQTQLRAVAKVRPLTKVKVYSRDEANRKAFAETMSKECAVEVEPVANPIDAVQNLDVIATATTAREPILLGEWIAPGQHLNIAGSNFLTKTEIDVEVVRRANLIAIDSKEQGRLEAGDLAAALDQNVVEWIDVTELGRIVAGRSPGRTSPQEVTLFKSLGIGLEDVAVAGRVYAKAKEAGIGTWLDL